MYYSNNIFLISVLVLFGTVYLLPIPDLDGDSRDGIGDLLNPSNLLNNNPLSPNGNGNQGSSPIQGIQNALTGSAASDALKDTKLFLTSIQGVITPASSLTTGFFDIFKNLGSNANIFRNLGNIRRFANLGQVAESLMTNNEKAV